MYIGDIGLLDNTADKENKINVVSPEGVIKTNGNSGAVRTNGSQDISEKVVLFEAAGNRKAEYKDVDMENVKEDKTPLQMSTEAIDKLAGVVTPENYDKMEELGIIADEEDPAAFVSVNDRINIELATYCDDYVMYGDVTMEELESVFGSSALAGCVASKLRDSNIPITEDNIDAISNTIEKAMSIGSVSEGSISYILKNELTPSVDNVYTSIHSGAESMLAEETMSQDQWQELEPQVTRLLQEFGMDVSRDNLDNAKWMMEQKIPVTPANLEKMSSLKKYNGMDEKQWAESIVATMEAGFSAGDTLVAGIGQTMEEVNEFLSTVSDVTGDELQYIVKNNYELTIRNLEKYAEENNAVMGEMYNAATIDTIEVDNSSASVTTRSYEAEQTPEYITARRQLEEIRLMMTASAGVKMLTKGIQINTEPLENIVMELKAQEKQYTDALFESVRYVPQSEDTELFKDTMSSLEIFKMAPAYTLGQVLDNSVEYRIDDINEKSAPVMHKLIEAGNAYDTMMTQPRKDLGDSISKAFANVDDILEDMGMEQNVLNQRAVRILAYNRMEITTDNINAIKNMDIQVTKVIDKMTPKAVVSMISQGINPLNTNIAELGDELEALESRIGKGEPDKYSEFLWKLQKDGNISREDREAYIGIYRLLHLIDKGDHSVIGALVNEGADITLNNMLTALRSQKAYNLDISIEVDEGIASEIVFDKNSISKQLENFSQSDSNSENDNAHSEDGRESSHESSDDKSGDNYKNSGENYNETENAQIKYYTDIKSRIIDTVTPQVLNDIASEEDIYSMSLERFLEKIAEKNAQESDNQKYIDGQYNLEKVQQLRSEIEQINESVLEMLLDSEQVPSVGNVMIAQSLMSGAGRALLGVKNLDKDKETDDEIDKITDFNSEEEVKEAYENISAIVERDIDKWLYSGKNIDVQALSQMYRQVRMIKKFSEKSTYHVPVEIGDEVTSVRVTVITGGEEKGRVNAYVESPQLGNVSAEFKVNNDTVDGIINASDSSMEAFISSRLGELEERLEEAGFAADTMGSGSLYGNPHNAVGSDSVNVSNKRLYRVAKIFITSVKEWGNELIKNKELTDK